MSAAAIARYLISRRFQIGLDESGEYIVIRPAPSAELVSRIAANKLDLIAYLREHLPASTHRYVLRSGACDRGRSVCLSCGIPPMLHGAGALEDPLVVDDPDDAVLIEACAIVAAVAAAGGPA